MLPFSMLQEAEVALGRNLTAGEKLWLSYSADKSDYVLYLHNAPFLFLVFSLVPLPYVLLELCRWENLDNRFKLQPKIKRSFSDMYKCYKDVITMFALVVCPLLLVSFPAYKWLGVYTSLELPSKGELLSQLVVYLLIEDYMHYWLHRLLHSEWFYRKIHYKHHEYNAPFGFAAPYGHWAEVLILRVPTFLGPAIVPCHITTFWLWIILRQAEAIDIHKGYEFPWALTKYIPFYGGADHHDFHHFVGGESQSNFASVFTYCDFIYGTDKGYRHHRRIRGLRKDIDNQNNNPYTAKMQVESLKLE